MSWLICKVTRSRELSLADIVLRAVEYVVLAACAGTVAVYLNVRRDAGVGDLSRNTISRTMAAGWVYVPCLLLLYWEQSPWTLLAMTLAALSTAFGLSRLFPHPAGATTAQTPDHPALPSLNGLPPADSPFQLAFWTALAAQACLICLIAGYPTFALLLLATAVFLPAWRWSALDVSAAHRWIGRRPPLAHAVIAVLMTAYALAWGNGSAGSPGRGATTSAKTPPSAKPAAEDRDPSSGYYGIILWPPPKKTEMVDPALDPSASESGHLSKPLLIPFDGPYWYFKAPANAPSPRAHVARGEPTDVNIRSTNWSPLMMEAHQTLSKPIDAACCSEIDVALTNGDTRPGVINVGVLWTDTTNPTAPHQPQLFLGVKPIPSSQLDPIPQDRAPVKETLRFDVPPAPSMQRFNQITVIFMPSTERGRFASKVSVESFELIPKP
jgi:hypothetical protein